MNADAVWLVYRYRHGSVIAVFTARADLVAWLGSLPPEVAGELYVDRYDVGVVDVEMFPIGFVGGELLA